MAKKKKEPEPVELEVPERRTVLKRTQDFTHKNEKTLWRSFLTALIGVLTLVAANGNGWIEKYFENQQAQGERQKTWQARAEARHQQLLKNDSLIIQLLTSKTKK